MNSINTVRIATTCHNNDEKVEKILSVIKTIVYKKIKQEVRKKKESPKQQQNSLTRVQEISTIKNVPEHGKHKVLDETINREEPLCALH